MLLGGVEPLLRREWTCGPLHCDEDRSESALLSPRRVAEFGQIDLWCAAFGLVERVAGDALLPFVARHRLATSRQLTLLAHADQDRKPLLCTLTHKERSDRLGTTHWRPEVDQPAQRADETHAIRRPPEFTRNLGAALDVRSACSSHAHRVLPAQADRCDEMLDNEPYVTLEGKVWSTLLL
ncbi:MAG TPA: hypothetical protein VFG31_09385 [Conexibacter sp.]|nr:hypothetical protein [Conexibacter sp.]